VVIFVGTALFMPENLRRPSVQIVGRPKKVSREQIVVAALDVMEKEGFAALSMRSLARELGINHSTLYNYVEHIGEVEKAALDVLMDRIPMPDRTRTEPIRAQLIDHLLAVRQTQIVFPKFCHAPPGTPAWRLQMACLSQILDSCCSDDEQMEHMAIAYNTLISVVAHSAEHNRSAGNDIPITSDLEAISALPKEDFEPLFRPLRRNKTYKRELSSFVYRLDYLISCLAPHIAKLSEKELSRIEKSFAG